jgi:hypothetical protein
MVSVSTITTSSGVAVVLEGVLLGCILLGLCLLGENLLPIFGGVTTASSTSFPSWECRFGSLGTCLTCSGLACWA